MLQNKSGKINILLLVPSFDTGGPGTTVLTIACFLDREKFNPIICSMRNSNLKLEERAKEEGIKVINLKMNSIFDFTVFFKLYRIIKKEKIDILHNHGFRPEIYGALVGRFAKCKGILATIHHNPAVDIPIDYGYIIGGIMNFLRQGVAFFCEDVLVALTEDAKRGLIKLHFPEEKIRIIPTGSNPYLFTRKRNNLTREEVLLKFGIPKDKFVVGTIAVLKPRKGLSYLIKAAKKVIEKYQDVRFLIIGSGPLEKKLKGEVKSLGLQEYILFQNYYECIADIYKSINLFVLPSLTEGIPAVLLEAMAFGVPIVATQVGGIPEMIENGVSGILVPPKNSEVLADAIIKIYENPHFTLEMAKNARIQFEKHFTAEVMARQYEKVYEELIKK